MDVAAIQTLERSGAERRGEERRGEKGEESKTKGEEGIKE